MLWGAVMAPGKERRSMRWFFEMFARKPLRVQVVSGAVVRWFEVNPNAVVEVA